MNAIVQDGCISCGACVGACPEVFDFDEDGMAQVIGEVTAENESDARAAQEACPVSVIDIEA